jgi:hypothetical protein
MIQYTTVMRQIHDAHHALDEEDPRLAKPLCMQGCTEDGLAATEKRLGARLPFSYRQFLLEINGCPILDLAHGGLLPADRVGWLRDLSWNLLTSFCEPLDELEDISEDEHLCYGTEQDCGCFRRAYVPDLLQIGDEHDGSVYLLNPQVVDSDGEWEAWSFAHWYPGAVRYPSFEALVTEAYEQVLREVHLTSLQVDGEAIIRTAVPELRRAMDVEGLSPTEAVMRYIHDKAESDESFAAWMRTTQPYFALLEALGYKQSRGPNIV